MALKVCVDVDGTLFDLNNKPRREIIELVCCLADIGYEIYIWSGGGVEYARNRALPLFEGKEFTPRVIAKGSIKPEIALDDQSVNLGYNNIMVDEEKIRYEEY